MNRGEVVVCILGAGTDDGLRAHTPSGVPIVEVDSEADAFARAAPADVVLIRPGCLVAAGWLDGLRAAAGASATTATATALTQHDVDGVSEPFEDAAASVRAGSLRLRPRIAAPGDACVYVRRGAIELVAAGGADFAAGCVERGLAHVLADDVLVLDPRPARRPSDRPTAPAARAVGAARRAARGLTVTIDARILEGPITGTHVHVLELITGLARSGQVRLTAIVPNRPAPDAAARLRTLPGLKLAAYDEAPPGADVVHRPFQLSNAGDLTFLESLGERLILTQQDLIAFHNPAYFPTPAAWREYRQLTRMAMSAADRVLFFSAHARDDALGEELVDAARASVVHLGVDHRSAIEAVPPAGADRIRAQRFVLCLGTDYLHKNRLFALRLLDALGGQGSTATLVFAGPTVAEGSSRLLEERFLGAHPELAGRVTDLGPVSEAEKHWLYGRAALVVYPTVTEGFGLVPFEAAAHEVPCLWAPGTSLSELLPETAAGIVPWDELATARKALALMHDDDARRQNLSAIVAAAASLTWDATASRLLRVYRATADAPARPRTGSGPTLSEDAARLVGPGGELPPDVHRPLLALATHPWIARPVYGALKLGYRASHRVRQRRT